MRTSDQPTRRGDADSASESPPRHRWIEPAIVALLCACFAFLVISQAATTSSTYDETWHLTAGYTAWLWNDYRMSPDHPPLIRKLAAVPLLFMQVWPTRADWTRKDDNATLQTIRTAWALGFARPGGLAGLDHLIFYGIRGEALRRFAVDNPLLVPTTAKLAANDFYNNADRLLFWARMPILLLGLLLGLLIFSWARELYGGAGGILALALFCFNPSFIAQSGVVTTDLGVTVFLFGAVYFFWRLCRRLTLANAVWTGLFCGLALASKTSAVLLVPILGLLGLIRIGSGHEWNADLVLPWKPSGWRHRLFAIGGLAVMIGAIGTVVVWGVYGFRYSAAEDPFLAARGESAVLGSQALHDAARPTRLPGHFPIEDDVRRGAAIRLLLKQLPANDASSGVYEVDIQKAMARAPVGWVGRLTLFLAQHHLLPEAFIYGSAGYAIPYQRTSFLRGEYSSNGFRSYFLWSFLWKTPLITLAAIGTGLVCAVRRRDARPNLTFLLVPAVFYFLVAVLSRVSVGHRHLLPVYPFLFVLCGVLAAEWKTWRPRVRQWTAAVAMGVIAFSAFMVLAPFWKPAVVYPHYLAYFNELAGGPRNGYQQLVDSNLDWGQDLRGLKRWLDEKGITEPINLCYFGTSDPRYYGIPFINLPGTYEFAPQEGFDHARVPGYVAISATNLQGAYFSPEGRAAWRKFLAHATLVDTVGYSIFIYRLE